MVHAIGPQEVARQRRYLVVLPGGSRMDPVQESSERRGELAGLMVRRLFRHAWTSGRWPPQRLTTHRRAYRSARTGPPLPSAWPPSSPLRTRPLLKEAHGIDPGLTSRLAQESREQGSIARLAALRNATEQA